MLPTKVRLPELTGGLARERLERRLDDTWARKVALVTGPAGSGKTTLVARYAAGCGAPIAWYRAEALDGGEQTFLAHVEAAVQTAVPGLPGGWHSTDDAIQALGELGGDRLLLVVDDAHALEGSPAEQALGRLIDLAPPSVGVIVASRILPDVNVPRHRVSEALVEIDADDLRFRSWEVEHLFRTVYDDPVRPDLLACLTRSTEGWAAGLQLFHLASRGKTLAERERFIHATGSRSRLIRDYVGRNVLAALPNELGDFLRQTCVLGRLSGPTCDRLLARTGSSRLLEELVRRQVFTVRIDDEGAYRYHEVLRLHLDRILVEDLGEEEARLRYRRAGELHEDDGDLADALVAFCRAEAWPAVERLVRSGGERLVAGSCDWLEGLPTAIARHQPWIALATARRARAAGHWQHALEAYARAEEASDDGSATAARERAILAAWLDPAAIHPDHWLRGVRAGLTREPATAAVDLGSAPFAERRLGAGLVRLASGQLPEARRLFLAAVTHDRLDPSTEAVALLGMAACDLLAGSDGVLGRLIEAGEAAERAGLPWVSGLARGMARRYAGVVDDADGPVSRLHEDHDASGAEPWSRALLDLLDAWLAQASPVPPTDRHVVAAGAAADSFRSLGSGVLEAWSRSIQAVLVVRRDDPDGAGLALEAEEGARTVGAPGALLIAYRALDRLDDGRAAGLAGMLASLERECDLARTPAPAPVIVPSDDDPRLDRDDAAVHGADRALAPGAPAIRVATLGEFRLEVNGVAVPLWSVRPRARQLLRLLAVSGGRAVHREVIAEHLWPESDATSSGRCLQVAVSSLRGLLATACGETAGSLILRDGDAYRLAVPPESIDLVQFERLVARGQRARESGSEWRTAYVTALELYRGELLPEDGPSDWIVVRRGSVRTTAAEVALALAEDDLAEGRAADAIRQVRHGLEIDRFHDGLWRLLIEARERSGASHAAHRDRREYEELLSGLA